MAVAAYVPLCTGTVNEGQSLGYIDYYDSGNGYNSENPIQWLSSVTGSLGGDAMSSAGPGTVYNYEGNGNGSTQREYLIHRTDGTKNIDPGQSDTTVGGQKYVLVRTEVEISTGAIYVCAIAAKTLYSQFGAPGSAADAKSQYEDNSSVSSFNNAITLYESGPLSTNGSG